MSNLSKTADNASAGVVRGGNTNNNDLCIHGEYLVECFGPNGELKWSDSFPNSVTDEGKKFLLDKGLTGTTTINARMILFSGGTPGISATYGGPLVTEITGTLMFNGTLRSTPSWAAAAGSAGAAQTKGTSSAVVYSVVGAGPTNVAGAGIVIIANAVGNMANTGDTGTATATLYSTGTFSATKSVTAGDVLNVSYVTTLS